jgi:VanZ family protein
MRLSPAIVMAAAIFVFSSLPSRELPDFGSWDVLAKKGAHGLEYGLLAVSLWGGLSWKKKLWWLAIVAAAAYGATDELHQSFTPGRHPSVIDVGIDTAGAAVAIAVCGLIMKSRKRSRTSSRSPGWTLWSSRLSRTRRPSPRR